MEVSTGTKVIMAGFTKPCLLPWLTAGYWSLAAWEIQPTRGRSVSGWK